MKVQYYIKTQLDESSEIDENSGVDRNSVKLVDECSVVVQNTGLKLEGLDEKTVVDQRVFSQNNHMPTSYYTLTHMYDMFLHKHYTCKPT